MIAAKKTIVESADVVAFLEAAICMTDDVKTQEYIHMALVRQRALEEVRQQKASKR